MRRSRVLAGIALTAMLAVAGCSGDGGGEGGAALDCLWWPPHKISGRYLAPFLYHGDVHAEPEPPRRPLEVEVALPREWHEDPMALDPYGSPRID